MPYAPGDRLIINPDYVHGVGQQVKADAQNLIDAAPNSVQELQTLLTQVREDNFPLLLSSTFSQFITIHFQGFTQLFQDRLNIGDALQDAASTAEQTEINTMASFSSNPNVSPNLNTTVDGPQEFPIFK